MEPNQDMVNSYINHLATANHDLIVANLKNKMLQAQVETLKAELRAMGKAKE